MTDKFSKNSVYLLLIASVIHFIVFLLNFDTVDWKIQWQAAVEITKGTPLYEQSHLSQPDNAIWLPPRHFPIFFYLLALIINIFGQNQLIGKLFLWLWVELLFFIYLKYKSPEREDHFLFLILVYFFHPMILGISYFSTFDPIVFVLFVLGVYMVLSSQEIKGGLLIGLGGLVKFLPLFAVGPLSLLFIRRKNYRALVKLVSASLGSFAVGVMIYVSVFENFLQETLLWQSTRLVESNAMWIYFFPQFLDSVYFLYFEIFMMVLITILLYFLPIINDEQFIWTGISATILIFIFVYRSLYAHYGYWFTITLIPISYELFVSKRYQSLVLLAIPNLLFVIINLLCGHSCATRGDLGFFQQSLVISIYLTVIVQLIILLSVHLNTENFD